MENIGSGEDVKDLLDYYQSQSLPHVDAKFEAKSTLSSEVHGTFIEECFHPNNARSMEDIQSNLKAMESKGGAGASWAAKTISTMANMSPTSMTITHRQLQEGSRMLQDKSMSDSSRLAACLEMEYRARSTLHVAWRLPRGYPSAACGQGPQSCLGRCTRKCGAMVRARAI